MFNIPNTLHQGSQPQHHPNDYDVRQSPFPKSKLLHGLDALQDNFLTRYRDIDWSNIDWNSLSDIERALLLQRYFADGNRDANMQVSQNLLEYLIGEQNYQRSLPVNQVANLMSAGMSRAGAFNLLSGGGDSQTQVSPISSDIEGTDLRRNQLITNTAFQAIDALQRIATLPFDIRAKAATADLLRSQDTMLNNQQEGLALSAAAVQAAANSGFTFDSANANDLLQFLSSNQNNAALLSSIGSNPYAFASLTNLMSQEYQTRAQSFEPKYAEARALQQQALQHLSENEVASLPFENAMVQNAAYRDAVATDLYQLVERAKAENEYNKNTFEAKRFERLISAVREFSAADLQALRFQVQMINDLQDPEYRQYHIENLVNSERYQAAQALYGYSVTDIYQRTLQSELAQDIDAVNAASKKFFYGITLGGYESQSNLQKWFTTSGSVLTGIGAVTLAGWKIFGPKAVIPPVNSYQYQSSLMDLSRPY